MTRVTGREFFWQAVAWAARHFLATWGIVFAIAMIVTAVFGLSGSIGDIWFISAAPFMFVVPVAKSVGAEYGESVGNAFWVASITAIYVALDVALWTVIRTVRRAKAIEAGHEPGRAGWDLLGVAWLARHWFSLWAIVTAIVLFIGFGLRADFYEPNIKGLIIYGGFILALPLWPFFAIAEPMGVDLSDPLSRGIALSCFVVVCIAIEFAVRRRGRATARQNQSSAD